MGQKEHLVVARERTLVGWVEGRVQGANRLHLLLKSSLTGLRRHLLEGLLG